APRSPGPRPADTRAPCRSGRPSGLLGSAVPGHVVEVMDRVVDEIPCERLDGEPGSVAADAGPLPLIPGYALEPGRDGVGGRTQPGRHRGGVLLAVTVGNGRVVLVPVGVVRLVDREHQ